ncbi:MAG: endonuclease domain-containing protein [Anaerolineae bacterium]|nr:endonuclease domain-containing protein [Anaerolineae bacterium]
MTNVPWKTPPELWEKLKPLARQMRHDPTPAEEALWQRVRRNQLGVHFRRQHPIERFVVDFYCTKSRLVIEVDGPIHDYTPEEDAVRQTYLESLGLRVLRVSNADVLRELDGVIARLVEILRGVRLTAHNSTYPRSRQPIKRESGVDHTKTEITGHLCAG